jgi:hypothetical protein
MGDAIARLREAALAVRRHSDQRYSEPRVAVSAAAASKLSSECHRAMLDFESGQISAERYARALRTARRIAELYPAKPNTGNAWYAWVEWLPPEMKSPPPSSLKPLVEAAAKEALGWGSQFAIVESRIRALAGGATELLSFGGPSYSLRISRWEKAFDALSPFLGEPPQMAAPADAGLSPEPSIRSGRPPKSRGRGRGGGRKDLWPKPLKRRILADRSAYERKMARRKRPPLKAPTWVRTEWATAQSPSMEPDAALRLWRAAKRAQYR